MSGGIRYIVCCDDCGVDAQHEDGQDCGGEYITEQIARSVRDWTSKQGGWLWRNPGTNDDEWLSCPECAAVENLSVAPLRLT